MISVQVWSEFIHITIALNSSIASTELHLTSTENRSVGITYRWSSGTHHPCLPPELFDQHLPARAPTCNARFLILLPVILSPCLIRPPAYLMLLLGAYGFVFWDFAMCACAPSMFCAFKFCQSSRHSSGPTVFYHSK